MQTREANMKTVEEQLQQTNDCLSRSTSMLELLRKSTFQLRKQSANSREALLESYTALRKPQKKKQDKNRAATQ
jgi:hypothetical protein